MKEKRAAVSPEKPAPWRVPNLYPGTKEVSQPLTHGYAEPIYKQTQWQGVTCRAVLSAVAFQRGELPSEGRLLRARRS